MLCWAAGRDAAAFAALLMRSRTSPGLQLTCGRSQRCPMLCCCLPCNELVVSALFPRDGSQYSRETKPAAGTAAGRLSRGNALPACGKPGRAAFVPWLESRQSDLLSVQIKCYWADVAATAPFHPDGRSRPRGLQVNVQVCWCCSFRLGAPSLHPDLLLLHWVEQQHRSTRAGETCTVRNFFIILPCQSGTL